LLNASSCDQLFGELSEGSSNGSSGIPVITFSAHVACSVAISASVSDLPETSHSELLSAGAMAAKEAAA
jgi:hypothetical protein